MSTAREIITAALLELNAIAETETPTAAAANSGIDSLNALLDQYKAERLTIPAITRTTWSIVASDGSYTVGTGGDVNVARPVYLDHVNIIDTSTDPDHESPLYKLTDAEYAGISYKAQTATTPSRWYYSPTVPTGTLTLWPTPTGTTLEGALYAPAALSEFTDLTTDYDLPPAYRRMLIKNLAVDMASAYGHQVSPELGMAARESLAVVKRANRQLVELVIESAALGSSGGAYDITAG